MSILTAAVLAPPWRAQCCATLSVVSACPLICVVDKPQWHQQQHVGRGKRLARILKQLQGGRQREQEAGQRKSGRQGWCHAPPRGWRLMFQPHVQTTTVLPPRGAVGLCQAIAWGACQGDWFNRDDSSQVFPSRKTQGQEGRGTRSGRLQHGPHWQLLSVQVRGSASLFGLGFQATVQEMKTMLAVTIDTVYADEKTGQVRLLDDEIPECSFLAMLVGLSWTIFFRHDAISTSMKTAFHQCSLLQVLVGDMQSPAFFQPPSRGPGTVRGQCKSHRAHPGIR